MHKFLLLMILSIVSIGQTKAQIITCKHTLEGEVRDSITAQPIQGVKLSLVDTPHSISTDQNGHFIFQNLCSGTVWLRVEADGYIPSLRMIVIDKEKLTIKVLLKTTIEIKEVSVVGKRTESNTIVSHQISEQQLKESKGKSLSQQLTAIAGVTMLSTGTVIQKPVINGLHSQRVLILNQGVRQEGQQWGAEHAPEIDPFTAGHLEVSKGAQAVRYGADALAGVVLLTPNNIDTSKILSAQVDLIGNSNGRGLVGNIALEGNKFLLPKLAWRLQGSAKKQGNIKTAEYYLGNTGLEEGNFSALFQYPLSNGKLEAYFSRFATNVGIFTGAHAGSAEDILIRIKNGRPFDEYEFSYKIESPRQHVTHTLGKLKYDQQLNDHSALMIQYAIQQNRRQEFDRRKIESDNTPMADMELTTQSIDAIYSVQDFKFGAQGTLQINNNIPGTGTTPIIPNFDNHTIGFFAIGEFQRKKLRWEVGMRYDYRYFDVAGYRYNYQHPDENGIINQYLLTDQRHMNNVSGTIGFSYPISSRFLWKSNASLAWRAPSANELYSDGLHHGSGTYEIGDPNLKSEKGIKWVNHFSFRLEDLHIHSDIYAQYIADYIYVNPNPDSIRQTIRGTFPVFTFQQNNALFYGFDAQLDYHLFSEKLAYTLQASLVRAKNISLNRYLPQIPSDRITQHLQWNFDSSKQFNNTYVKLSHQFVTHQTRYEALSDYAAPPAAYHLFAVYANTDLQLVKQQLSFQLGIENLTNTLYKDYMDRFRYYTHQQGRNVSLRVSFNF